MEASPKRTASTTTTTTRLRRRKAKLTFSGRDRKIANERERKRVNTLNVAIGELKKRIPDLFVPTSKTKSTFGKLEVIKIATEYIDLLENTIQRMDSIWKPFKQERRRIMKKELQIKTMIY